MIDQNYEEVVFFETRKRHGERCRDRGKRNKSLARNNIFSIVVRVHEARCKISKNN